MSSKLMTNDPVVMKFVLAIGCSNILQSTHGIAKLINQHEANGICFFAVGLGGQGGRLVCGSVGGDGHVRSCLIT